MELLQAFNKIMEEHKEIALATSADNQPNVRIVNFYYDPKKKGILYFSTFGDNQKVKEFSENKKIAFTTIPSGGTEHVRGINAIIQISGLTIYDLKEAFSQKIPDYEMLINEAGNHLVLYEIHFKEANVTIDVTQSGTISL